jgi:beta-lactamase superfamily II metal-dependent hydrolase
MTVWQLPNQTKSQIMSYVLETGSGNLVVIDGGVKGDSGYLKGFIAAKGNRVHTWIITHAHDDHFGALCQILTESNGPAIGRILGSLPESSWVHTNGYNNDGAVYDEFLQNLSQAGRIVQPLAAGAEFTIDKVRFQILAVHRPEITQNAINNSSLVMRVSDRKTSILFTADLGVEGCRALLASPQARWLQADYLQMAHHGQNGVEENFYQVVKPRVCLWPTPAWLWDNDSGKGKGSGPWQTLKVREWMDRMGIRHHIVMKDGLARIP